MKPMSLLQATMAATAVALAAPASAAFYVDDTTGGPTFNRALVDFSDVSAVGTDVAYDVYAFTVSNAGDYIVRSFAEGFFQGEPWDQAIFLYSGSFDPSQPLVNGVIANDDYLDDTGNIGRSGFDISLTAGTTYFLVTTGFGNEDQGRFVNIVRGPGDVMPVVPEPETYALLALGLVAVTFAVRRRGRNPDDD